MAQWRPDPTFYPSARLAMQAPRENLAYVAAFNPKKDGKPDAMTVVDLEPGSSTYGHIVGKVEMPNAGDELHHFGWNACSSALCPYAPHPHIERRYLIVPGLRSSRIHILDTKPDPRQLKIVRVIEPEEVFGRARYSRFHTIHCGPEGIYISALGSPDGGAPGDGVRSWMVKLDADSAGRLTMDPNFFVEFDGYRSHQIRLEGGDCSSDSYCYP
ncbi:MAG: selenium-binding protein SBP56-related protein [Candidatus Acidiferrales bacterium]